MNDKFNTCDYDFQNSIDNLVEKIKSYPLSNYDIKKINPNIKITLSTTLKNMRFIDEIFSNVLNVGIILWLSGPNFGHWIGLIRNEKNKTIEIFDSYAYPFKKINEKLNSNMNISPLVLINVIKKSGYKPIFNKKIYQNRKDKTDSTCGRWVLLRLALYQYSLKEFDKYLKDIKKKYCINPLELAVITTYNKINK